MFNPNFSQSLSYKNLWIEKAFLKRIFDSMSLFESLKQHVYYTLESLNKF